MPKLKVAWSAAKRWKWWIAAAAAAGLFLLVMPTVAVNVSTRGQRYDASWIAEIPERDVVIVFGAGVRPDGTLTPYLENRVSTAVDIYNAGKVQKILMTGDNSAEHYNEPVAMQRRAIELGVPEGDIVLDYAGFNTYDSCYRAKEIFSVTSAVLVTQGYHLPRAVATCGSLGIDSTGVAAKRQGRDFTISYLAREHLSTIKALIQGATKPSPTVLGNPEGL